MLLVHQIESLEQARKAARSQAEIPARELEQVLATRAQALHTSKVIHLGTMYRPARWIQRSQHTCVPSKHSKC